MPDTQQNVNTRLPLSKSDWVAEVLAAVGLVVLLAAWFMLPAQIPISYGPGGAPDDWGTKYDVSVTPTIVLITYFVLLFLNSYPQLANYPRNLQNPDSARRYILARSMTAWLKAEMVCILAYVEILTYQVATHQSQHLDMWLGPVFVAGVFATIGIFVRTMYLARTPETAKPSPRFCAKD